MDTVDFFHLVKTQMNSALVRRTLHGYRLDDAVKKAVKNVEAVRNMVGERIDIMLDGHGRSTLAALPMSYLILLCKESEPLRPLWK